MANEKKETGYYWAFLGNDWEIVYYNGHYYTVCGNDARLKQTDFKFIGLTNITKPVTKK